MGTLLSSNVNGTALISEDQHQRASESDATGNVIFCHYSKRMSWWEKGCCAQSVSGSRILGLILIQIFFTKSFKETKEW